MNLIDVKNKLGNFIEVINMTSVNGNDIPNQYILKFENGTIFQSYSSVIVIEVNNKIYLTDKWDYSKTTGKYRNIFLNEDKKETEKKIKSGEYILI